MLKLKRKTYFFFVIFLSIFTFLIYLFLYENNPVNNYYNNFSNTFFKLEKLNISLQNIIYIEDYYETCKRTIKAIS